MDEWVISIISTAVGGLFVFASSYAIFQSKRLDERRKIALGFKKEIEFRDSWFEEKLKVFRGEQAANIQNHLKQQIIADNSLYFALRKDIFCLGTDTVDDLLGYYSNLFAAEGRRKTFLDILWPEFKENNQIREISKLQRFQIDEIARNIEIASKMKGSLTQKLDGEMANTITDKIMLLPSACWKKMYR